MANFIIDLFKKSLKGNNLRPSDTPTKYVDGVAVLNSTNQNKPTTTKLTKLPTTTAASGNTTLPGK